MPSSPPVSTSSTAPTCIPAGIPATRAAKSEAILGKWLKARGNRDKVIIATKLGIEMGPGKKGLSRTYMMQAVEASLRRLQTDYIDLYQSHRDDPDTPIEETLSGLCAT